jgi:hypothetical protein
VDVEVGGITVGEAGTSVTVGGGVLVGTAVRGGLQATRESVANRIITIPCEVLVPKGI